MSKVAPSENYHMKQNELLSAKTLIAVAIVFLYTIASPIMKKFKFHFMHESGMSMMIGLIVTLIALIFSPTETFANTLYFDDAVFFNFILPPIIFSAGYNLRRKSFFKYIAYILLFGVVGTIISFLIIASITYVLSSAGAFTLNHKVMNLSIQEILLFSCVISATDTLSALTFIKEEKEAKLFSILFGEGVFNDAVALVLYKIITDFTSSKEEFTTHTAVDMISSFAKLFIMSLILGLVMGLICTLFLKKMKHYKLHRVQECSIIVFFAFFSYTIAELLGLSPIISLLFSAMFMSHYSFYNLSFQAREESSIVSKIMANIAEAFVFTYLGLTFISMSHAAFSFNFLVAEFLIVVLARYTSVYSISVFINLFNSTEWIIKPSERGVMAFAGSIRGAIAFGLAISIQTGSVMNDEALVSTTLILVFFTTIVFGALLPGVIKYYKRVDEEMMIKADMSDTLLAKDRKHGHTDDVASHGTFEYTYSHPNNRFYVDECSDDSDGRHGTLPVDNLNTHHKKHTFFGKIRHYWNRFDNHMIKPWLLHNWPQSKIEHEEISVKIKNMFTDYQKIKINRKISLHVPRKRLAEDENQENELTVFVDKVDEEEMGLKDNMNNGNFDEIYSNGKADNGNLKRKKDIN